MDNDFLDCFNKSGIYGLIVDLDKQYADDNNRVKAYNLLKLGRSIAKKCADTRLDQLPYIALDLSRHESIYRMAAFLYIEIGNMEKGLECLSYLYHYYQDQEIKPHDQYNLISQRLNESYSSFDIDEYIEARTEQYQNQKILNSLKDYTEVLPEKDINEQIKYFNRVYSRYGSDAVIASINSDVRFNNRQKAILLIRASRSIGAIAEEGPSIESIFAEEAMKMDTSDTVINNIYQAYLRAGDLNKVQKLKSHYPYLA